MTAGLPDGVEDLYPLSPVQAGMLFHALRGDALPGAYVGQAIVDLLGDMDVAAFEGAWADVVASHDALRAAFLWEGLDRPVQAIMAQAPVAWRHEDWSALDAADRDRRLADLAEAERLQGFDLARAPLMRMTLVREGPDRHRLVWTCHHIVSDGWSHAVLLAEALARTEARRAGRNPGLPEPAAFGDYLGWLEDRDREADRRFWTAYLDGFSGATALPAVGGRAAPSDPAGRLVTPLDAGLSAALADASRTRRVTTAATMAAAFAATLRKLTGEDAVTIGLTSSVRPAEIDGIEYAAGVYINTQPLRIAVDPAESPAALVARVQSDLLARRAHEHVGLSDIQAWSPLGPGRSLFETLFVFENTPEPVWPAGRLRVTGNTVTDQSEYPLALLVRPGQPTVVEAVYDRRSHDDEAIRRLVSAYIRVLEGMVDPRTGRVGDLVVARATDLAAVDRFNDTARDLGPFQPLHERVAGHASAAPDAPAVSFGETVWSRAHLDRRAAAIAAALSALGVGRGDTVAIALPRGLDVVAAMLGILRAGAAYAPLDVAYPPARLAAQMAVAEPRAAVVAGAAPGFLPSGIGVVDVERLADGPVPAPLPVGPDDLAYIIFTSGSTGRPKAVAVTHDNLFASTLARPPFFGEHPDAFLVLSSFAFDSSVAGVWWALAEGGRLVISEPRLEQDAERLGARIARDGVTHLLCLPSLWREVLAASPPGALASLRTAIVAGEAVTGDVVALHRARLPGVRLVNEYGPTEATVWCTAGDIGSAGPGQPVPIGGPIANTTIHVLDPDGARLPAGLVGDIHVGGRGVARGYLGDPAATARAFVPDPFSPTAGGRLYRTGDLGAWTEGGTLVLLGRRDGQVKVRGHRIEPGDVEALIRTLPGIRDVAVVAPLTDAGRRLVAFTVTDGDPPARAALVRLLPPAMVPDRVERLDRLPELPNGKVDRATLEARALAPRDRAGDGGAVPPRTPFESTLAGIWAAALGRETVGIHDDFFALGGDSLLSIRVVAKARAAGLSIVPHDLFDFPTIAELAAHVSPEARTPVRDAGDGRVGTANLDGSGAPFFMVHGRKKMFASLARGLAPDHPLGFLFGHWETGDVDPDLDVGRTADQALDRLRAFQPAGPYRIGGYSFGSVIAFEMAQRLAAVGETVELLFLLDPPFRLPGHGGPAQLARSDRPIAHGDWYGATAPSADDVLATTFVEKLAKHARVIRGTGPAALPGYLAERARRIGQLYVVDPARFRLTAAIRRLTGSVPQHLRFAYVTRAYHQAFLRYRPRPWSGRTLVVATHDAGTIPERAEWTAALPGADVEMLDVGHVALQLDADALERWMVVLSAALNRGAHR